MSNQSPIEVPQGAIRFNTDSQKLEFFAQDRWYEMATNSPTIEGGSGRGITFHGSSPYAIDFNNISSAGNAQDFGDDIGSRSTVGCGGDRTRVVSCGGQTPTFVNSISFIQIATTGDAQDFGDMQNSYRGWGSKASNGTRTCMTGGSASSGQAGSKNNIEYITVQTTGNSVDFGDMVEEGGAEAAANPIRAVMMGRYNDTTPGTSGGRRNNIDFITMATLGNAQDFGDLSKNTNACMTCSSAVRGVAGGGGGGSPDPGQTDIIRFVTFTTLGDATDFGNLVGGGKQSGYCFGDTVRGVWTAGYNLAPTGNTNQMDYINIATGGTSVDFGDQNFTSASSATSNAHGGLF